MLKDGENKIRQAYEMSQNMKPLLCYDDFSYPAIPLTYEDSSSPVPNHPVCALGVMTAKGKWGSKKGVAVVIEDNYLLTCASNCYSH